MKIGGKAQRAVVEVSEMMKISFSSTFCGEKWAIKFVLRLSGLNMADRESRMPGTQAF